MSTKQNEIAGEIAGPSQTHPTPAQDVLNLKLRVVNEKIAGYLHLSNTVGYNEENKRSMKELEKERENIKKKLRKKETDVKAQQKFRARKAEVLHELKEANPDIAAKLAKLEYKKERGRPPVEDELHGLHEAILSIVTPDAGADEKRRTALFNSVKTLEGLHAALNERGYCLSKTATYYRLMPSNAHHKDAQRHKHTVPITLSRPQSDLRKPHVDAHFAMASVKYAKELAALFTDKNVFFLSQDDKARVPIGIPISKKQTAILMHMDHLVSLPDHDFPIGERHKLIPSAMQHAFKKMVL